MKVRKRRDTGRALADVFYARNGKTVMPTTANANRPQKKGIDQNAKALGQLRKRLEDSLTKCNDEESRFVITMINVLSRVNMYDRDLEIIIDSVRNLTLKRRLRAVFW
jgi:hypothetical protein